jgi:hypothetical protein
MRHPASISRRHAVEVPQPAILATCGTVLPASYARSILFTSSASLCRGICRLLPVVPLALRCPLRLRSSSVVLSLVREEALPGPIAIRARNPLPLLPLPSLEPFAGSTPFQPFRSAVGGHHHACAKPILGEVGLCRCPSVRLASPAGADHRMPAIHALARCTSSAGATDHHGLAEGSDAHIEWISVDLAAGAHLIRQIRMPPSTVRLVVAASGTPLRRRNKRPAVAMELPLDFALSAPHGTKNESPTPISPQGYSAP